MFDFIGIVGFIGFLLFLALGYSSRKKDKEKSKKRYKVSGVFFALFIIGALLAPPSEETVSEEVKGEATEKKEDTKEKEKAEPKEKKEPATVSTVKASIKAGMSDEDFKKAKKKLGVEHPKSISIGNGNVGYVLQATDGFVVATTDGGSILEVLEFKTIEEVDTYEKDMVAKAEAEAKEKLAKEYEESKIKLSGKGDTASDGMDLKEGYAIFDGLHSGNSNFAVVLQDANGNDMELLVNDIGNYQGKTFAEIPADGTYYLNITAGGSWEYTITQSPPPEIVDAPTTLEGKGDDVVFFNTKSGNHKFTFAHEGQGNFAVILNGGKLLVNEIGAYEGSMREQLTTDGYYAFVIVADGSWKANIEKE